MLIFKRLTNTASIPARQLAGAGYDLSASGEGYIPVGKTLAISTGIACIIPAGCYGRVAPRSSLSLRGLIVGGGVIDPNYHGELKVIMSNLGPSPYAFYPGDRVAQLILEKHSTPDHVECIDEEQWNRLIVSSVRGSAGFGSTGV